MMIDSKTIDIHVNGESKFDIPFQVSPYIKKVLENKYFIEVKRLIYYALRMLTAADKAKRSFENDSFDDLNSNNWIKFTKIS